MPSYFLDASAIVKRYIREPGSVWVRELGDARDPDYTCAGTREAYGFAKLDSTL